MDKTPSSSRCSSSTTSSPWLDGNFRSETPGSTSDISGDIHVSASALVRSATPLRKTPSASASASSTRRLGLSRPFRSPIKRSHSTQGMNPDASSEPATSAGAASPRRTSSTSIRRQREPMETRLTMLRQASKCLREDALNELPKEIARWREAGQLAAQDLWKMTGAQGGDWSTLGGASSLDDYGLESPPSTLAGTSSQTPKGKAHDSQQSSGPLLLLRRSRISSPGAEEAAAALRSTQESAGGSDPLRRAQGEDSQGALSEASLPDISELLRRSQSVVGSSSTPRQQQSLLGTQVEESPTALAAPAGSMGIERKWNIGSMLDMLGADKTMLAWDAEEEEFRDAGVNPS